jgi:hypothetical protein
LRYNLSVPDPDDYDDNDVDSNEPTNLQTTNRPGWPTQKLEKGYKIFEKGDGEGISFIKKRDVWGNRF